jgi:tetratricopeptide (TPR) repeat protein
VDGLAGWEPETLARAARVLDDPRLLLDAALLQARSGNLPAAYAHALQIRLPYPEAFAYLALDYGEHEAALRALDLLESGGGGFPLRLRMLQADLYLLGGREEAAQSVYRDLMRREDLGEWRVYANSALIAANAGKAAQARTLLHNARQRLDDGTVLTVAEARVLIEDGRTEQALGLLQEHITNAPADLRALSLYVDVSRERFATERVRSMLWRAFWSSPDEPAVARLLGRRLLDLRDAAGLDHMLDAYESRAGVGPWSAFYRAMAAVARGDAGAAERWFTSAADLSVSWVPHYNLGVLFLETGRYEAALRALRRAESGALARQDITPGLQARVRLHIAGALAELGDVDGALRELSYATDLDPSNPQALLLQRQLEAGIR